MIKEIIEHIVFVGGDDKAIDWQPHLTSNVTGANIAKIARWYAKADFFVIACGDGKIGLKVINDLRKDTAPVDRVHRTEIISGFECRVLLQRFDDILTVIKHTVDGDIMDIVISQAIHLRTLKLTHLAMR